MRLAVVGKGGAGKSTIAATMARIRGRQGTPVLAADLDVNPGLAISLGIPVIDEGIRDDAVEAGPPTIPYGFDIRSDLGPEEAVARYAQQAPDGVRFLQIGNIGHVDHGLQRFVVAIRRILRAFRVPGWDVIGDFEAGASTPYEGYVDFADRALIVVEPTWSSALAARRIASVIRETGPGAVMIGNKVRNASDAADVQEIARQARLPLIGLLAFDPAVAEADRLGLSPVDHAPDCATIRSLTRVAEVLA